MDSAARTLYLGDDMVTEILLLLPLESIFRYRSLSKQWNSLLTSPEFLSRYSRRFHDRQRTLGSPPDLLGFFLHPDFSSSAPTMPFLSTHPRIGRESFSSDLGYFITSSNGLVLCRGHTDPRTYHILNPMTRKHVSLPPPRRKYPNGLSVGLSCDEDGDGPLIPRYEVVIADIPCLEPDNMVCIETYSSETEEWRESVLVATSKFTLLRFCPPTVLNGVFYWWAASSFVASSFVAVYDPHNKQRRNEEDRSHLQLIQLPPNTVNVYDPLSSHVLNQTPDGRLIFGRSSGGQIKLWELWTGNLLIYEVPIGVKLVGLITWNPLILMVVRLGSGVFQYNMQTKRMKHMVSIPEWELLDQPFFEATSFSSYLLA